MAKLEETEKRFYEMLQSQRKKKISVNLAEETVEKIDDLAEVFKLNRTLVLESVLIMGIGPYLDMAESMNLKMQQTDNNPKLKEMLKGIEEYRKRWNPTESFRRA